VAALALAAAGEASARPPVPFQADAARLAAAPPELRRRLQEDPFVYFRYLNTSWAAAVCEAFRDELPGLPTAVLHGDAHLEQYAMPATDHGLDDFDDAGRGPAVIDLARFLGSLELTLRQRGWLAELDRVFDGFFEAYRHALADPSYLPPEPAVVRRLRAGHSRSREQLLAWGDSLMEESTEREHADAVRSLRLVDGFVRELRPELPAGYFELKRWGWLHMGVGSLLARKALLRVEGPSPAAGDDELIEAKQVSSLAGVACVQVPLSGEVFRVIEAAEQIGRIRHTVLVVAPRREDQRAGLRDWWIRSWDESYVELATADLATPDELAEVARDVGAQLGSAGLRHSMPALEAQLRQVELRAVRRLEPRIRATSRRLVTELLASWDAWRAPR
jgi:hypothetical protein